MRKKIEDGIEAAFGFAVTVVLRTTEELEPSIRNCPFTVEEVLEAESSSEVESLYVSLLTKVPSQEKIQLLNPYRSKTDKYQTLGREVFLLFHHSIRKSRFANNLKKLDVPTTVRNWKTIKKIALLAKVVET